MTKDYQAGQTNLKRTKCNLRKRKAIVIELKNSVAVVLELQQVSEPLGELGKKQGPGPLLLQ